MFENNDIIKKNRLDFISGKNFKNDVSREVYTSWLRSREAEVDPAMTVLPAPDSENALEIYNEGWGFNYHLPPVEPHMKSFESYLIQTGSALFSLDLHFNVVFQMGSPALLSRLQRCNLSLGANLSESLVGTNAAALSLAYNNGISIIGAEHYIEAFQEYACSAFTYLSDRETAKGCFLLVTPLARYHPSQLVMLQNWSYLISNSVKLFKLQMESNLGYEYWAFNSPKMEKGLIFVDYRGIVLRINDFLLNMNLCPDNYCGEKLEKLFPEMAFTLDCIHSGETIKFQEVRLNK